MKTLRKYLVLGLSALALLFLLAALSRSLSHSAPAAAVSLSVSPQTSNSIAGKFQFFTVTNGTSRKIDCGNAYVAIKINGEWQPWQSSGVDVETCDPESTNRFCIMQPEAGEAWRVKITYIPMLNDLQLPLARLDYKLNLKLFKKLDYRKSTEAISEEIRR